MGSINAQAHKAAQSIKRAAKKARKAAKRLAAAAKGINSTSSAPARLARLPKESRLARVRMRGWNDVVDGKPFRDNYELWPTQYKKTGKAMQLAYERGRGEAAMALAVATRQMPPRMLTPWAKNEYVQGPMYRACGALAGERIIEEMRKSIRSTD